MKVVNPYYARESSVGSVFDVATWHPPKPVSFGFLVTVALTVGCAAATLCAFFPELLGWFDHQWSTELQKAIGEAKRDYAWAVRGGAALGLLVTYALCCITVADQALPFRGEFYFRAGPGGFSLRLPNGLDRFRPWYQILQLDAPWPEIASWRIVQHKQLGSLSPNAGNLHADLHLKLANGKRYLIPLAWFREPARVIWRKIEDAVEMVPMQFTPETLPTDGNDAGSISKTDAPDLNDGERRREDRTYYVSDADELYQEVQNALSRLIQCGDAFVIVSDSTNDKFVQFFSSTSRSRRCQTMR